MINKSKEGTWRVRIKFKGRVIASSTFKRRAQAVRWEAEQKRRLQSDDWIDPKLGREPLRNVVARWLEMRASSVAGKTYQTDEYMLRVHIPTEIGKLPIGSIRPSDIESMYIAMNQSVAISSVRRFKGTLSPFFGWVVRERIISDNPVTTARLPVGTGRDSVDEIYPYTLEELREVIADLKKAGGRWSDLALVLGLTGIRWGELMALRCRDVQDVPGAAIHITRSAPDGQEVRNTTKGGSARTVPLVEELVPLIRNWTEGRAPGDLIFANSAGNRTGRGNWTRAVHWNEHCRGRRIHDLRHTAATLWLSSGVDPKTVQHWLGHASMTLTLDVYAHYMKSDADSAGVARMNRILGTTRPTSEASLGDGTGTEIRMPTITQTRQ